MYSVYNSVNKALILKKTKRKYIYFSIEKVQYKTLQV